MTVSNSMTAPAFEELTDISTKEHACACTTMDTVVQESFPSFFPRSSRNLRLDYGQRRMMGSFGKMMEKHSWKKSLH